MGSGFQPRSGSSAGAGNPISAGLGGVSQSTIETIWDRLRPRIEKLVKGDSTTEINNTTVQAAGADHPGAVLMDFYSGSSFHHAQIPTDGVITEVRIRGGGTFRIYVEGVLKAGPLTSTQTLSIPFKAWELIRVQATGVTGQPSVTLAWR